MNKLTYTFPLAAAAFLILLFAEYLPLLRRELPEPQEAKADARRWTRRDSVLILLLTLVYGFVAFLGLGDTRGVQSFFKFWDRGVYTVIELREPVKIGAVRYYSGLYTGEYYLQFSADGETYYDAATLEQKYSDLFKWNTAELEAQDGEPVRYIRLLAGSRLWLGEIAFYDVDGRLLTAEDFIVQTAALGPMFDEQALVPEESTYLNSAYFDEIYHPRTALEHIENVPPYEISHPPLGKLILGLGIRLFGMTPFGWRFSGTLIGVLMLPALYLFLKKLCGGTAVPGCGTAVFAFDFMHYVQTRIATIDSYAVFFTILMYLFFWLYWSAGRERRKDWLPYLALSGVCFGLGAASKWTCIYAGGGLAVLWGLDRVFRGLEFARTKKSGEQLLEEADGGFWRETADVVLWSLLFFVLVPAAIYYVSYWPYGTASGMRGMGMLFSGDYAKIVLDNQKYMFSYHSGVTATHPYSSVWWQWMLDIRPILYYLQYLDDGTHVSFGAWVNPLLCWGGLLAMLCMAYQSFFRRDKTALFILVGYLAQLLPWTFIRRVVFEYHYFPSTVFLLLALAHVFRTVELEHPRWKAILFSFTGVSVGLFALFYPALRGLPVSGTFGDNFLKWLPTWPF